VAATILARKDLSMTIFPQATLHPGWLEGNVRGLREMRDLVQGGISLA
jgi:hypothetical protein